MPRHPSRRAYAVPAAALLLCLAGSAAADPEIPDPIGCGPYTVGIYGDPGHDRPVQLPPECVQPMIAECEEIVCSARPD